MVPFQLTYKLLDLVQPLKDFTDRNIELITDFSMQIELNLKSCLAHLNQLLNCDLPSFSSRMFLHSFSVSCIVFPCLFYFF